MTFSEWMAQNGRSGSCCFAPNQNVYGGTVTLGLGGKVNYLDYTH